jgi:hypothetical protein
LAEKRSQYLGKCFNLKKLKIQIKAIANEIADLDNELTRSAFE